MQSHAPVGDGDFSDGCFTLVALDAKFKVEGAHRMQQLQNQLASAEVTEADSLDAALITQELRRVFVEVGIIGGTIVEARKAHVLRTSFPDDDCGSFKDCPAGREAKSWS